MEMYDTMEDKIDLLTLMDEKFSKFGKNKRYVVQLAQVPEMDMSGFDAWMVAEPTYYSLKGDRKDSIFRCTIRATKEEMQGIFNDSFICSMLCKDIIEYFTSLHGYYKDCEKPTVSFTTYIASKIASGLILAASTKSYKKLKTITL